MASIMLGAWGRKTGCFVTNLMIYARGCSSTRARRVIVRLVQFLHTRGRVASALSYQILKSGTSAGANYEEADGGSSPRDKLAKRRIVLRELMETHFRLRVLRHTDLLTAEQDPVINETAELVKIVAKIIHNSSAADPEADS